MGGNPSGEEIVNLPYVTNMPAIELRSLWDHYYELETNEQEKFDQINEKRPYPSKPS